MKLNLLSFVVPVLMGKDCRCDVAASTCLSNSCSDVNESPPITSTLQGKPLFPELAFHLQHSSNLTIFAINAHVVSQLMYSFAELRSIVDDHEKTFNEGSDDTLVEFDSPDLIDTRNSAANPFPAAKMRNPVTAVAVLEFVNKNEKYIKDIGSDIDLVKMRTNLEELKGEFDAEIIEFDDEFADNEGLSKLKNTLVYSIVVNR